MSPATLLLADNNLDFLETTKHALENAGYSVLTATTPEEAQRLLLEQYVDIALLDMRLKDDKDENDTSGLEIAKNVAQNIPKVIISDYESFDAARNALGIKADGLPIAVEFVKKSEGNERLLKAISKGLELVPYFQRSLNKFSDQLDGFFRDARNEAKQYNLVSLLTSVIGILVILFAGILGIQNKLEVAVATAVAGIIVEAIGYLAFKRSDAANIRRDRYHAELLKIQQLDILLAACSTLNARKESRCREKVIDAAISYWLAKDADNPEASMTVQSSE
jgi:CheY-like chemotaxis protein